jgi:hypothetical protein
VRKMLLGCAAAAALGPAAARAEAVALTYAASVYADGKGAPLRSPEGVACDDAGAVVVADTGNARLVRFAVKDGAAGPGAEVKAPQLAQPVRVQLDGAGNAVVLDRKGNRLLRFDARGAFAGGIAPKDGSPFSPVAFKVDAGGGTWAVDAASARIVLLAPDGAVARAIPLPPGVFTDVAVDAAGTVYAVEAGRAAVWSAPKGASALQRLSKELKDEMSFPTYLTVAGGRLLVVDQNGSGVVVLGPDGAFQGRQLAMGASEGLVYYPGQVCATSRGEVWVADRNNHRVEEFTFSR